MILLWRDIRNVDHRCVQTSECGGNGQCHQQLSTVCLRPSCRRSDSYSTSHGQSRRRHGNDDIKQSVLAQCYSVKYSTFRGYGGHRITEGTKLHTGQGHLLISPWRASQGHKVMYKLSNHSRAIFSDFNWMILWCYSRGMPKLWSPDVVSMIYNDSIIWSIDCIS